MFSSKYQDFGSAWNSYGTTPLLKKHASPLLLLYSYKNKQGRQFSDASAKPQSGRKQELMPEINGDFPALKDYLYSRR
ncbi:hypothetical protein CDAR_511161 [Caerostris darwini]|uniref:Uncharacterized protein n=1 Tax=Caerostris darwini TaxID=1538125 RepID=A0AAV4S4Z0_9ARAC|nr:hypothetical protein CDAR_511161 [Caerostris darwini]